MMRYGLEKITKIDGADVTADHREAALALTECEALEAVDAALSQVSPGIRRYGGTFAAILENFNMSRGVIEEEMTRIAYRNLEAVVTGNMASRRVLNLEIAVAEKEARDSVMEPPTLDESPVEVETPSDPDFLD